MTYEDWNAHQQTIANQHFRNEFYSVLLLCTAVLVAILVVWLLVQAVRDHRRVRSIDSYREYLSSLGRATKD